MNLSTGDRKRNHNFLNKFWYIAYLNIFIMTKKEKGGNFLPVKNYFSLNILFNIFESDMG